MLCAIEQGRAYYMHGTRTIYLPREAYVSGMYLKDEAGALKKYAFATAMKKLFDNCTIRVEKDEAYVKVNLEQFHCKNIDPWGWKQVMFILRREMLEGEKICEACLHYLKHLVNECNKNKFGSAEQFIEKKQSSTPVSTINDELWQFKQMKKGYLMYSNFDSEVSCFTKEHVEARLDEFQKVGSFVHRKIQGEKKQCASCIKYKTQVCRGLSRYSIDSELDGACKLTEESFNKGMMEKIQKRYGSLQKALWYFSQCGRTLNFKDPNTKRISLRRICMPICIDTENINGKIDGFYMGSYRYPISIKPRQHQVTLTKKEYLEIMEPRKITYDKKAKDALFAAEIYREEKRPGTYIHLSGHANYLAHVCVGKSYGQRFNQPQKMEGTFACIIGAQTSRDNLFEVKIKNIQELLKETRDVNLE